jgi:hypothetical protein
VVGPFFLLSSIALAKVFYGAMDCASLMSYQGLFMHLPDVAQVGNMKRVNNQPF